MRTFILFLTLIASLSAAQAAHPIPKDSKQHMDFRGKSNFTNPDYEKLFSCTTYEELRNQLLKAIASIPPAKGEEWEDSAQANMVATCQLALIRTHYILGEIKEADALLSKLHPVY